MRRFTLSAWHPKACGSRVSINFPTISRIGFVGRLHGSHNLQHAPVSPVTGHDRIDMSHMEHFGVTFNPNSANDNTQELPMARHDSPAIKRLRNVIIQLAFRAARGHTNTLSLESSQVAEVVKELEKEDQTRELLTRIALTRPRNPKQRRGWDARRLLLEIAWNDGKEGADERAGYNLATMRDPHKGSTYESFAGVTRTLSKERSDQILKEVIGRGNLRGYDGLAQMLIVDSYNALPHNLKLSRAAKLEAEEHLVTAGNAAFSLTWDSLAMAWAMSKKRVDRVNAIRIWEAQLVQNPHMNSIHYTLAQAYSPLCLKFTGFRGMCCGTRTETAKALQHLDAGSYADPRCAHAAGLHYFCVQPTTQEEHIKRFRVPPDDMLAAMYFERAAEVQYRRNSLSEGKNKAPTHFSGIDVRDQVKEAGRMLRAMMEAKREMVGPRDPLWGIPDAYYSGGGVTVPK